MSRADDLLREHYLEPLETATTAAAEAGLPTEDFLSAWEKIRASAPPDFAVDKIVVTLLAPPDGIFKVANEGKSYLLISPKTYEDIKKCAVRGSKAFLAVMSETN